MKRWFFMNLFQKCVLLSTNVSISTLADLSDLVYLWIQVIPEKNLPKKYSFLFISYLHFLDNVIFYSLSGKYRCLILYSQNWFKTVFQTHCIFLTHTFFIWRDCQNFNFHQNEICLTYAWFLCKKGARTYLLVSFVTLPDYQAKYPKHGIFIPLIVCCKTFI